VGAAGGPARHEGQEVDGGTCAADSAGDVRCENDPNDLIDADGDGKANSEDADDDNDGATDDKDDDADNDGEDDEKAVDQDGDGKRDWEDEDIDGDGKSNSEDSDPDGDGEEGTEDWIVDGNDGETGATGTENHDNTGATGNDNTGATGSEHAAGVVGTWRRESNYGASSRTITLTFNAEGAFTGTETFNVVTDTEATNAGCHEAHSWSGTWSTHDGQLTVTATSGSTTITQCTNAELNTTERAATEEERGRVSSTSAYTLAEGTLAFTCYLDPAAFSHVNAR